MAAPRLGRFADLRKSRMRSDVSLIAHGEEFRGHASILGSHSPVLEDLIVASQEKGENHTSIKVAAVFTTRSVTQLLDYLYVGEYNCPSSGEHGKEALLLTAPEPKIADVNQSEPPKRFDANLAESKIIDASVYDLPRLIIPAGDSPASSVTAGEPADLDKDPLLDLNIPPITYCATPPSTKEEDEKPYNLEVENVMIQHFQLLGLASAYEVDALADMAREKVWDLIIKKESIPLSLRLLEELANPETADRTLRLRLYNHLEAMAIDELSRHLLFDVIGLGDKLVAEAQKSDSIRERVGQMEVELAASLVSIKSAEARLVHAEKALADVEKQKDEEKKELAKKLQSSVLKIAELEGIISRASTDAQTMASMKKILNSMESCRHKGCNPKYQGFKGFISWDVAFSVRCKHCYTHQ